MTMPSNYRSLSRMFLLASAVLSVFCQVFSQGSESGLRLRYAYPENTPVRYLSTNDIIEDMDIGGQQMTVKVFSIMGCTVRSTGSDEDAVSLMINIDTMAQTVDNPGLGSSGGAIREVIGRTFSMKITSTGIVTDILDAGKISYITESSGKNSMDQVYSDFFPVLPAEQIVPGYSWSKTDSVTTKTGVMTLTMKLTTECRFTGIEQIDGIKCARIDVNLSGYRDLKAQTQGMDIRMKGPFTGTGEIYFSMDRGYFIRNISNTRMQGDLDILSPDSMSFPLIMITKSETKAVF